MTLPMMMWRVSATAWRHGVRYQSTAPANMFSLYPKNFPHGGPPHDPFVVNDRALRREYKLLQLVAHPDKQASATDDAQLTEINKSYRILSNPYTRLCHLIQLHHPAHVDISDDAVAKDLIAKYQNKLPENLSRYKEMLMTVLDAHELLELADTEKDLEELETENDLRIGDSEDAIDAAIRRQWPPADWDELMIAAIKLKYWVNIQNACKEWEPGKPVHLTH